MWLLFLSFCCLSVYSFATILSYFPKNLLCSTKNLASKNLKVLYCLNINLTGRTTSVPISAHCLVLDKVLDFDPDDDLIPILYYFKINVETRVKVFIPPSLSFTHYISQPAFWCKLKKNVFC